MYKGTIISLITIMTPLSHLSHPYNIFQFCLILILKPYPYDIIIRIITLIYYYTYYTYDIIIRIITLITLIHIISVTFASRKDVTHAVTRKYIYSSGLLARVGGGRRAADVPGKRDLSPPRPPSLKHSPTARVL